ncbi:MAG: uracil-DNA glycosylase [Sulfuriflexus sp.]|nr:uracil-DNA glycosylase [Sulfuriflexus sp.]
MTTNFDIHCQRCPRLSNFLKDVRKEYPSYYGRPVPPFGVKQPELLIVGLAPGMHGANATGRPFTGDYAGILLYETLYKFGFSTKSESVSVDDGLKLKNCRITNAVKCLPPQNKPTTEEVNVCNELLREELQALKKVRVILVLGLVAHKAVLKACDVKIKNFPFGHDACAQLPDGRWLLSSYHCSKYNTSTKRLTEKTFHDVFKHAQKLLSKKK